MSRLPFPAYCLHRATDQAFVTVRSGAERKVRYLGLFGSEPNLREYERVLKDSGTSTELIEQAVRHARQSLLSGTTPPSTSDDQPLTVLRLYNAFQQWAPTHYRLPDGSVSREVENFRHSFTQCLDVLGRSGSPLSPEPTCWPSANA